MVFVFHTIRTHDATKTIRLDGAYVPQKQPPTETHAFIRNDRKKPQKQSNRRKDNLLTCYHTYTYIINQ